MNREAFPDEQHELDLINKNKMEILLSFGPHYWKTGFGHYFENDARSVRESHNERAIRRILNAMEAGFIHFNMKFEVHGAGQNFEVTEGEWTLTHFKSWTGDKWDKTWKLKITKNGKDIKRKKMFISRGGS
ncbi:Oidioi.mRNA.OKI2018_I69.chr2.g6827.t2.cds [Oikopleura dioica]|uniref:Oidioi.mRNA.OKI2018_I69.chr2.g6827.t2.cds n=1 Tax=Oikopleura dioica TaxID=34765 RepID=A0ABN7T7S2_OIKDI|nr:Oidioi.mRNA.OKI2018_I69.chr2.g6827.t2.cds [Oikopleura dioica]